MKKLFYKVLSIILVTAIMLSTLAGCGNRSNDEVYNGPQKLDACIIENNASDYKIVIAEKPTAFEEYAAEELSKYLYESTGVKLKVVKDNEVSLNDKLISIGYNSIQDSNVSVDYDVVGDDGFLIKTVGDDLYLLGGASTGTLYSVYEVLEYLIDFRVYAADEIIYSKNTQVSLFEFDMIQVPSFETRYINTATFNAPGDVFDAAKLRVVCYDYAGGKSSMQMTDDGKVEGIWGCWAHTIGAKLLPWSKYYNDHPEWFEGVEANDAYQVMMSNPDVIAEVAKNLKSIMDGNPSSKYFMVGINDNGKTHSGDKEVADANGGWGGLYMLFLNAVEDKIAEWYKEEGVERDYRIVGLAYMKYIDAPVDEDLNPVNNDVIANDKVAIMYAPIQVDWSAPITDKNNENNQKYEKALRGWANISKEMFIWSYSISFGQYLLDFDNYATLKDNYNFYKDIGVIYMFDQAAGQTVIPFNALRDYVQASLMWDVSANTGELIEEFIDNYYKVAAPYIKELFYTIRRQYKMFMDQGIIDIMHCGNSITNQEMLMEGWSWGFCEDAMEYINKALEAVEESSLSQETKDKLVKRIKLDSIMPRYIMLDKFKNQMLPKDYAKLVEDFAIDVELFGVTCWNETYGTKSIDSFIESCRAN